MHGKGFVKIVLLCSVLGVVGALTLGSSAFADHETTILAEAPGFLLGVGTHFQVSGSSYINVEVTSTEELELYVQSAPKAIMLATMPTEAGETELTLAGLVPSSTYYKYEDDFHDATSFQADDTGTYTFTQEVSQPHVVFIQEHTSTIFLNSGGGGCLPIGDWNPATLTCTLTQDVTEAIEIDGTGITLDGAGFTLQGSSTLHTGILVRGEDVTIRNLTIRGFIRGIFLNGSASVTIADNDITASHQEVGLFSSHFNVIRGNVMKNDPINTALGIESFNSNDNQILDNEIVDVEAAVQLLIGNNRNTIVGNTVIAEHIGLFFNLKSSSNIAYNNDIHVPPSETPVFVSSNSVNNSFSQSPPTGGNYWTAFDEPSEGCVDGDSDGFCDAPFVFPNGQDDFPHVGAVNEEPSGNSNVLFLPGFKASRLYRQGAAGEDKLWLPTVNQDATQLYLNDAGEPIDPSIYTRDAVDTARQVFDVYDDFIQFMDGLVAEGTIKEWQAYPYDWRFAVDDIAAQAELQQAIADLAATADSSKVTIIAHSNGGNVAKALLIELEEQQQAGTSDLIDSVDRLVMVATPQLGTPKALGGLLHGYDQGIPFSIGEHIARELGENMPSAYGLLPLSTYLSTVADPVVTFSDDIAEPYDFRTLYGESIDTIDELRAFLFGDNGQRLEPASGDLKAPNVLDPALLSDAETLQDELVAWQPPDTIEVIEVAGWGLPTVFQFAYSHEVCPGCTLSSSLPHLSAEPQFTIDGDKTVVAPSVAIGAGDRYYVNLWRINRGLFSENFEHSDILGAESLQEFIALALTSSLDELVEDEDISEEIPNDEISGYRLRMKSPVALHVYDSNERHTGIVDNPEQGSDIQLHEEQIPNSGYVQIGERKYVNLDDEDSYRIELISEGTGIFTFEIDRVEGDSVVETLVYADIPTIPELVGELTLDPGATEDPQLLLDTDGDGEIDVTVIANESFDPLISLELLKEAIRDTQANHFVKRVLLLRVRAVEHLIEHDHLHAADRLLRNIDRFIEHVTGRHYGFTEEEAIPLREMIAAIQQAL